MQMQFDSAMVFLEIERPESPDRLLIFRIVYALCAYVSQACLNRRMNYQARARQRSPLASLERSGVFGVASLRRRPSHYRY